MKAAHEHMPDEARLRELLVGKKVVRTHLGGDSDDPTGQLTLSDGTRLKLWGHDGGCACSAGCYPLVALNDCDNKRINLASFEGSDGNGYYGTGWWLSVESA